MKKDMVIHPLLFALFPVLFLFGHNVGEVPFRVVYFPLAAAGIGSLVLWLVLLVFFKDLKKSALLTSVAVIFFFSFGHVREALSGSLALPVILMLWAAVLLVAMWLIIRNQTNLVSPTKILNVTSIILIFLPVFGLVQAGLAERGSPEISASENTVQELNGPVTGANPNIYFIILDAYARQDVLKDIYNYDNAGFVSFLRERGFFVSDEAMSNYNQTGLTIASIFGLNYLDELVKSIGVNNSSRMHLWGYARDSRLLRFLRGRGYKFVSLHAPLVDLRVLRPDVFISPGGLMSSFYNEFIYSTPIPYVRDYAATFLEKDSIDVFREQANFVLDHASDVSDIQSPVFAYLHIEAPHPPFVFGANGEKVVLEDKINDLDGNWLVRPGKLTLKQYHDAYRDQLVYINKRIKGIIDDLLEQSDVPPVIVLMGDHGPRSMLSWESANDTYVKESQTILYALHLPGVESDSLRDEMSPVNTFRIILNQYFGADYELLDNRSYYSDAYFPYRFKDVTERVRKGNEALKQAKLNMSTH